MRDISMYAEYKEGIDKWYLVSTKENPNIIVNTTKVLNTGKSEYGYIDILTPPYKTRELLVAYERIIETPCICCGGVVKTNYTEYDPILAMKSICFSCQIWDERIEESTWPDKMVVDHKFYSIASELPKGDIRGFGGAKFTFVKNGVVIESTNVWFGGDIPKHFWDKIPDNATMINGRETVNTSNL